jgi:acyl-CoA synthetase (AMP-forming)/AMP-acid ligase II
MTDHAPEASPTTPWQTIPELLDDSCARYADLEALVDGDVRLTYAQLGERVDEAARAHMAWGLAKGDRFSVWAPNIWEWPVVALGGHKSGALLVPINTRFKGREAAYVLQRARSKVLFTVTDFLDVDYVALLRSAHEELPDLEHIVVLRGPVPEGCLSLDDYLARASEVDEAARAERSASVHGDDLCHILFTSGTTGAPKGAMLVHSAICKTYSAWSDIVGLRAGDRFLVVFPFLHSAGLHSGILACIMKGACNVPHPVFDVPSVMRRVVDERISVLPGPPAVFQSILGHPDLARFDMSSLRLAITGAAAVPVSLVHAMRDTLGFETVITGYGLTECSGTATMCRHDDDPETIANTSGRAIPDLEVLVVDEHGKEVPRGTPGEIVIRGYNVMRGYLDDPEQTAAAIDEDGWLHSGDVGVMDERGYVQITDRVKDMFIVGGFNAYPAEIENLMARHPAIAQVAVVGIPDERLGEVGMAFVVPRGDAQADPAEIIAWCRDEMANYKVPRRVELVSELPLNASGKVRKFELRARAAADLTSRSGEEAAS